jgi:carbon monoxide dehydrogenase subunit G
MSTVARKFTVDPPPEMVVPYLADFSNAEQWDPGTVSCVPNQKGPVQVGFSWKNTSKIAGITAELTYTLTELTASRIVLVGRNKTATSTETIVVVPAGSGSEITYTNDLIFKGAAKLAVPLIRLVFAKLANDTERQIKATLNGTDQR